MIVKQATVFAPITITLETRAEADLLWACLNTVDTGKLKNTAGVLNYIRDPVRREEAMRQDERMFEALDNVYAP